jgi:hypothetical protein
MRRRRPVLVRQRRQGRRLLRGWRQLLWRQLRCGRLEQRHLVRDDGRGAADRRLERWADGCDQIGERWAYLGPATSAVAPVGGHPAGRRQHRRTRYRRATGDHTRDRLTPRRYER